MRPSKTPDEVGIIWETMTCRGMRNYYERTLKLVGERFEILDRHPCRWFSQYGPFHAYDITVEDQNPWEPVAEINAFYVGQKYQIPELLSGCRKAPIMSVGLNPNLRAVTQPWRIYPYFDDIQQYAKHFRYRTTFKYSIEGEYYDTHVVDGVARFEDGQEIPLKKEHVSMYLEYDKILKALQERMGVADSELCLGEDVSYYNFVACHSPRWDMDSETEKGIVGECYHKRQFFLKQLAQSMPKVIILFGKPVMKAFVANFSNAFEGDNIPNPEETYSEILSKNNFVMRIGEEKARVIFSPHPTGARPWYVRLDALTKIVDALYEEYKAGNLIYDEEIKHFKRTKGACKFCNNDIYFIGKCKYKGHFEKEDTRSVAEISSDRKAIVEELAPTAE